MSISQLARSIKASPTLKLNETAAKLREKGEPVIHLGWRRAEEQGAARCCPQLCHPAQHRRDPLRAGRRSAGLKKAILRYTEEYYDRIVAPENVLDLERREAGHHEPALRDARAKGRGDLPRAVLGQLPGDGEAGRRRSGRGRARGRDLPADAEGDGREDRPVHEGRDPQQPEQPQRGRLLARVHRRHGGDVRAAQPLAGDGRPLQPARLRRRDGARIRTSSPATSASRRSSSWSRACRRCTR